MLAKGNLQQVSLLHVYHHASISCIWWLITYSAPGGDAYFSAALNSLVHVVMYAYYLLAILLGRDARARARYLFWGKYLTQFQMAQFVANLVQVRVLGLLGCSVPGLTSLAGGILLAVLALPAPDVVPAVRLHDLATRPVWRVPCVCAGGGRTD